MGYLFFFILFIYLILWPVWYFTKLARWGKGFVCPDFEKMNEEVYCFKHNYNDEGFFSYNRLGGKIKYYCFLLYFVLFVSLFLFFLGGLIYILFLSCTGLLPD